jgi:hypothetical protein
MYNLLQPDNSRGISYLSHSEILKLGNAASDSGEQDAYNVIRWIPGGGQAYSATRAIVYASKGDDQDSVFAIVGPAGSAIRTIRDSGVFDEHDVHTKEWVGDKRGAYSIPEDYFQGHLFDMSKFLYLFNDLPSDSALDLFQLSREDISTIEGECTNVPVFNDGSTEFSYFDAINTDVVLTSHLIAYSKMSAQCAVSVATYTFHSSNVFNWTRLNDTRRDEIESILREYRTSARQYNMEKMNAHLLQHRKYEPSSSRVAVHFFFSYPLLTHCHLHLYNTSFLYALSYIFNYL